MKLTFDVPDDEIRARAKEVLDFTAADHWTDSAEHARASGALSVAAAYRFAAAILRAAEQLDPTPLTRDTPPGTRIAHPGEVSGCILIGWASVGNLVYEDPNGAILEHDDPDGWYVVKGVRTDDR